MNRMTSENYHMSRNSKPLWVVAVCLLLPLSVEATDQPALLKSVTFYASFDQSLKADVSKGASGLRTRSDDPQNKGQYLFKDGYPTNAFRCSTGGVAGGALAATEVLPNRGRIFFPAESNLAYEAGGWDGTVSFWLQTNPDTMLRSRYCDPVQITHKGAHNGGLWIDFPDTKPRSLRLGAFHGLADGEKAVKESDPLAPLVRVPKIGFKEAEWHHIAMTWERFDSGKSDARASLHIDGRLVGELTDLDIAMQWDMKQTGIYVAVGLIGMMDELSVFDRSLTPAEVQRLHREPRLLHSLID